MAANAPAKKPSNGLLTESLSILKHYLRQRKSYPHVRFGHRCIVAGKCAFGREVSFGRRCVVFDTTFGNHSYCADDVFLAHVSVGAFTSIGPRVTIGMGAHPSRGFVSTSPVFFNRSYDPTGKLAVNPFEDHAPVEIGSDVWIGANVFIGTGRRIGTGAIIGTGAVVTKDVEPYEVVVGIPAKRMRLRFAEDEIEFLLKTRWWELTDEQLTPFAEAFGDIGKFRKAWEQAKH